MTKPAPATPQDIASALTVFVKSGSANGNESMRALCLAACNAYPQLVEDRAKLVEALRGSIRDLIVLRKYAPVNVQDATDKVVEGKRSLLRSMGKE
ncbi:MAG: hypothetical protein ACREUY_10640 [Burkholderiales bacterium]